MLWLELLLCLCDASIGQKKKKIKMFKKKRYIHDTTSTAIWHRTLGSAGPAHLHTKQLFSILLYSPNPKG